MRRLCVLLLVGVLATGAFAQRFHKADQDKDNTISFSELLRLIQFFNSGGYHCDVTGEDGYTPGPGDQNCAPHDADYNPLDWNLTLSELLRIIQIYNTGGYFTCGDGEDGFCLRAPKTRPNVVFLVLDTLREDRMGASRGGEPILPFISDLAAKGTRFTNAWTPASWTQPALAGMFTGRYPARFAERQAASGNTPAYTAFPLADTDLTIAEWLAKYGYDTWGVQTNANGQDVWGYAQGFPNGQFNWANFVPAVTVTDALLANQNTWKEPFFLFGQYVDPHSPYTPPTEYTNVFGTQPTLTSPDSTYMNPNFWQTYFRDQLNAYYGKTTPTYPELTANGKNVLNYRYDADCRYMDDEIKRLAQTILAKYPNTIFVMAADHGEALMERAPVTGHGMTVFEEMVEVPFFFSGPGVSVKEEARRCSTLSLMPSLARLLGISPELNWEGEELFHAGAEQPQFGYTDSSTATGDIVATCVVRNNLKLAVDSHFGNPLLFDLATDPGETTNLAGSRPTDVADLTALLNAHNAAVAK